MPDQLQQVAAEITRLHDFFTNWFAGNLPHDNDLFEREVSGALVPEFVNIQPAGTMLTREYLLGQINSGYGKNPAFQIHVERSKFISIYPAVFCW